MRTQLISSPEAIGLDPADLAASPGSLIEVRDDVLRDLMKCSCPIERPPLQRDDSDRPAPRTCV